MKRMEALKHNCTHADDENGSSEKRSNTEQSVNNLHNQNMHVSRCVQKKQSKDDACQDLDDGPAWHAHQCNDSGQGFENHDGQSREKSRRGLVSNTTCLPHTCQKYDPPWVHTCVTRTMLSTSAPPYMICVSADFKCVKVHSAQVSVVLKTLESFASTQSHEAREAC